MAKIFSLGSITTKELETGQILSAITESIDALEDFFSRYLPALALAGLIPMGILAVVFPKDPLTGLIFLITAPFNSFVYSSNRQSSR